MKPTIRWIGLLDLAILMAALVGVRAAQPVPDRLVVLTFDDSVASQYSVVRPILKRYGFGATFFITEGFSFRTNKQDYLTWEQIRELHDDGFEIGNHTRDHMGVSPDTLGRLREQVEAINARCAEYGIPKPVSFAYPGNAVTPSAFPILQELGIRFARRGGSPEQPYEWGRGYAFEPGRDHPLLIPSAGDARPDWTLQDLKQAADQARNGRVSVLQFHGVPDREHPWVNTRPERFAEFMAYLHTNSFRVVALRDLTLYAGTEAVPKDPLAIVEARKAERSEVLVEGTIVDEATGNPLPGRLYIQGSDGKWYFPKSASMAGSAVRYERRSGFNTNSIEYHTTLSAHPFRAELLPGRFTFTAERGKEWFPVTREVTVERGMTNVVLPLRRWINLAELGWYSGDTHNHRAPAEQANVLLAEDINVGLPMTDWTTVSTVAPNASGRGFAGEYGSAPVKIDETHVWSPRNTEYEIFRTGNADHTLGAIFILNHRTRLDILVFPLNGLADRGRAEGAILDLDKHNWPWSLAIIPLLKPELFELANNHHWATEYGVRNWAVPAPAWMGLTGSGTATERDWTLYGFRTYYALLNCGFEMRPSAGTASGVHPVPLGFGRVYVHLDAPFSFDGWMRGLAEGRSFVTTGPMIFGTVEGRLPGAEFNVTDSTQEFRTECRVVSEQPLETIELIVNGEVLQRFEPSNTKLSTGAYETKVAATFKPTGTSWLAWRCFETRPQGRLRFGHTAPSYFRVAGSPLRPRREEVDWFITRVKEEISRSQGIAPEGLIDDYRRALAAYERIAADSR